MAKQIQLICEQCGKPFQRKTSVYHRCVKNYKKSFCSKQCAGKYKTVIVATSCTQCNKAIRKIAGNATLHKNKSGHFFCNHSCATIYNNAHRKTGTRVSKLEKCLQEKLPLKYPELKFIFNGKEAINSELDIYIPSLKFAIELNGIFHYEPIYGKEKLAQIQNNDNRKFQACIERGISLASIDTSAMRYYKKASSEKYLKIVTDLIDRATADQQLQA